MATRVSPAANLLRKSRLFSLPPSIAGPAHLLSAEPTATSDTATTFSPIKPAIVTPASSAARGDWGLKRPLPTKSTTERSSRPIIRVNKLDTHEHITDFDSAADHTTTLEKWQEWNLPITHPPMRQAGFAKKNSGATSVFESTLDNMQKDQDENPDVRRYRFKGPFLAGQSEGEFSRYLKNVRREKSQFLQQLRSFLERKRQADMRRLAMEEGKDMPTGEIKLSDAEFDEEVRKLRADPQSLGPLIYKILDLPPPPPRSSNRISRDTSFWDHGPSDVASTEYAITGPPKTHPSAGLSYLRTGAHVYNHPVMGPQKRHAPVPARILRPRFGKPMAGVGGIVASDVEVPRLEPSHKKREELDPDVPGGPKFWVHPSRAHITSEGRITLAADNADPTSLALLGVESDQPSEELDLPDLTRNARQAVPRLDTRNHVRPPTTAYQNQKNTEQLLSMLQHSS